MGFATRFDGIAREYFYPWILLTVFARISCPGMFGRKWARRV